MRRSLGNMMSGRKSRKPLSVRGVIMGLVYHFSQGPQSEVAQEHSSVSLPVYGIMVGAVGIRETRHDNDDPRIFENTNRYIAR